MATELKPRVIAIEEHYLDAVVDDALGRRAGEIARGINDRLYAIVQSHPDRCGGFATLPTRNPEAAVDEFERCVMDLGFKGGMVPGLPENQFIDFPMF